MRSRIKPNGNISATHECSVICGPIGCAVDFVCRLLHLKIISLKKPLQIGLCNKADLSEDFEKDYKIIEKQKDENKIEVQKYCRSILNKCSRILVARVDLGYLQEYSSRIRVEDIYKNLDILLNRIQNKDGIFKHVIGLGRGKNKQQVMKNKK